MKLAKALKEKSRLVGEVTRIKGIIQRENSRDDKSTSKIDNKKLWADLDLATAKLVTIKTAIFKANTGIYEKIALIGELKSKVQWIVSINTQDGVIETPTFRGEPLKTVHTAYIKQEGVDNMTTTLQAQIAQLQDELDEYNATVEITV